MTSGSVHTGRVDDPADAPAIGPDTGPGAGPDAGHRFRAAAGAIGLRMVVAVLPVLVGHALLWLWLGETAGDYLPVQSDELSYWHQIMSFAQVGFDNGYYSYQEHTPPALSAYGAWGPAFAVLYGAACAVSGLTGPVAVVWLNAAAVVAVVFVALTVARLTVRTTVLVGVLLGTSAPLVLYVPTGMLEPLHVALGVLLAVLLHRLLVAAPGARARPTTVLVATVAVAALLRPTWALLLVPATLLVARGTGRRRVAAALAAGVAGAAGLLALFPIWTAPYPYGISYQARHGPTVAAKLSLLGENAARNVGLYVQLDGWVLRTGITQRYAILALLAAGLALAVWAWRRRNEVAAVATTAVLALGIPLAFLLLTYDVGNSTRVMGAHIVLVLVLLAISRPRWLVVVPALAIALNVVTGPTLRDDFVIRNRVNFTGDAAAVAAARPALADHLRYRPDADRWCNTVLVTTEYGFFYELVGVPAGVGISIDLDHAFSGPVRSGHVIAAEQNLSLLPAGTRLELVANTARGGLYRNLDARC